jgi:rare lipoprotein A (peptidoglycan hydrolase)
MRRTTGLALTLTLAVVAAGLSPRAAADSVSQRLQQARDAKAAAEAAVAASAARYRDLQAHYDAERGRLQLAARDVLVAYEAELSVSAELAEAQHELDRKAAQAYEYGPGFNLELLLGAKSPSDFASAQIYEQRALEVGSDAVDAVVRLRVSLKGLTGRLEQRQAALQASTVRLQGLSAQMSAELATARAAAAKAGIDVSKLEAEQQALAEAQASQAAALASLVSAQRGVDQSALLALLGPNQGKGCDIPSGLKETGVHVNGLASWYGPGFAGQHTASGAIFDPRLFTAANKELPLNTFVRVHYDGQCAIVLVNDRGPYGGGRVFDLSEGVAEYLGYISAGVVYVTTDVLEPSG